MSYESVSKIVKYSRQTIGEWVKMYNEGGIDKMLSIRKGRGRKARIKRKFDLKFCSITAIKVKEGFLRRFCSHLVFCIIS